MSTDFGSAGVGSAGVGSAGIGSAGIGSAGIERVILPDSQLLSRSAAARFLTLLVDAQAARGHAHAVLTGGSNGTALLAEVATSGARDAVDWNQVDLWWGDERFLPSGDPDRNETQARQVLLDELSMHPTRVHPMPPSDGEFGDDVDAAAAGYAAELAESAEATGSVSPVLAGIPAFDVLMLGVGPDGHVASLFPGHPGFAVTTGTVIAVRESPKPPPVRISLTLPALQTARETWLLAGGEGKADAVSRALGGEDLPAASVHGLDRTLWLLDRAAAAKLG
jgi:6-phosphogluconolactonase